MVSRQVNHSEMISTSLMSLSVVCSGGKEVRAAINHSLSGGGGG